MRVHDARDLRATAAKALSQGAKVARRSTVEWNVSGNCTDSKMITLTGRNPRRVGAPVWRHPPDRYAVSDRRFWQTCSPERKHQVVRGTANNPIWIDIEARCRKCAACLRARARMWTERAIAECRQAGRTWMGTLTLSPHQHHLMMCRASHRLKQSVVRWSSLSAEEQLSERHKEISKEITLWLKRVRKNSHAVLRFLLVMEQHKNGLPHYHVLIHEGAVPVVKRVLEGEWKLGFSKFKLVEQEARALQRSARYVAKYLTKANEARVRASVGYGNPPWGIADRREKRRPTTKKISEAGLTENVTIYSGSKTPTEQGGQSEPGPVTTETGTVPAWPCASAGTQTCEAAPATLAAVAPHAGAGPRNASDPGTPA